jgi:hypothetical protein
MSRKTRGELIDPKEVTIVHTVAKAARNLFLLGEDFALPGDCPRYENDWGLSPRNGCPRNGWGLSLTSKSNFFDLELSPW